MAIEWKNPVLHNIYTKNILHNVQAKCILKCFTKVFNLSKFIFDDWFVVAIEDNCHLLSKGF